MSIQVILLIIVQILGLSDTQFTLGTRVTSNMLVHTCKSMESTGYQAWIAVQFTFICALLIWGCSIAFRIRNTPAAFNESDHIAAATFLFTLFGLVFVPLQFVLVGDPDATMLVRGLGQILCSLSVALVIFGPKLFYIYSGHANDKSMQNPTIIYGHSRHSSDTIATNNNKHTSIRNNSKQHNNINIQTNTKNSTGSASIGSSVAGSSLGIGIPAAGGDAEKKNLNKMRNASFSIPMTSLNNTKDSTSTGPTAQQQVPDVSFIPIPALPHCHQTHVHRYRSEA